MKIAFVTPRNTSENEQNFYDLKFISTFLLSRKYFAYLLAIPTLVALTPPEHEVRVFDENIEDIDYEWGAALVGISVRTMFADRAYSISEKFRRRKVKTVLGGIHPSMCTEESLKYCDTVVIGEAEEVWQSLLKDAEDGKLKKTYKAEKVTDLTASPAPARSVLSGDKYLSHIIQTTKGCPFHCEFCSVHAFDGQMIRNKTIDQVLKEVREMNGTIGNIKKKAIFFADDNIIANRKYAKKLFFALKKENLKWSCQASINIAKEDELLGLMKESGCGAMLIGFESVSESNLSRMDKKVNMKHDYINAINKIHSHGILVHGSFILGYDFDSRSSFDELIDLIEDTNLLMPLINVLTPYPGTRLFKRLQDEGRILHKDWSKYDSKHVVFSSALLTPDELSEGYNRVIRRVYSFDSIYKRLKYFWDINFWGDANKNDPIKIQYRVIFAARLFTLLFSRNLQRSRFIIKILPKVFDRRVRISTILTLMAYNNYAYSS
jgi:radical SAM superfamily enzyme YgiQ (UPF0313 family)